MRPDQLSDVELLREAISLSGQSARQFALRVLAREDRTVRRWLAGTPTPAAARTFLVEYVRKARKRARRREADDE